MDLILDFSNLKLNDAGPIYNQIVKFVKIMMTTNQAKSSDELPSRRMLSVQLGVNPNTIQKAYKIMEGEGFVLSSAGAKSVLDFEEELVSRLKEEILTHEAQEYVSEMKKLELDIEQALELVKKNW